MLVFSYAPYSASEYGKLEHTSTRKRGAKPMNTTGRYAASDNSFTKSATTAAARGGLLIAIAIVVGFLLLWRGFDSGGTINATDEGSTTTTTVNGTETTTTTEAPDPNETDPQPPTSTTSPAPVVVDPPNSVKVVVMNGRGEAGLAGRRSDHLKTQGYVSIAVNAVSSDQELSRVYYTPDYADEAELVAVALNGAPTVTEAAPTDPLTLVSETYREAASDYHIYVLLGSDAVLG